MCKNEYANNFTGFLFLQLMGCFMLGLRTTYCEIRKTRQTKYQLDTICYSRRSESKQLFLTPYNPVMYKLCLSLRNNDAFKFTPIFCCIWKNENV